MSARHSNLPPRDAGFTLAEVMVVVVILGIVSSVFAMAAAQDIEKTAAAGRTYGESAETFLLSDKLLGDIREADVLGVGSPSPSPACGAGATPVLWTQSTDTSSPTPNLVVAAYAENFTVTPVLNQPPSVELDRTVCTGGSASKTVPVARWTDPAPVTLPLPAAPSAADVTINFGCDLGATPCKPNLLTLAAALAALQSTLAISTDTNLPAAPTTAGSPPVVSYYLTIEPGTANEEIVGVTADNAASLSLIRSAPLDHPSGAAVAGQPRTVTVTVPRTDTDWHSGLSGASDPFRLTVTRRPQ